MNVPDPPIPPEPVRDPAQPDSLAALLDDVRRLRSLDGLAFALASALPLLLLLLGGLMRAFGVALYLAALAGAYFVLLRHVAEGRPGLPQGTSEDLAASFWRGLGIAAIGLLPPLLVVIYADGHGMQGAAQLGATLLAALLGALVMPAAAVSVYVNASGLAAFAVHFWIRIIAALGRDYWRVALLHALALTLLCLSWALVAWLLGSWPTLALLVIAPIACVLVMAMAVALGSVIHRHRDVLGLG